MTDCATEGHEWSDKIWHEESESERWAWEGDWHTTPESSPWNGHTTQMVRCVRCEEIGFRIRDVSI